MWAVNGKDRCKLCLSPTTIKCVKVPKDNNYAMKCRYFQFDHQIEFKASKMNYSRKFSGKQPTQIQLVLERGNKKNRRSSVSILQPILLHWNDVRNEIELTSTLMPWQQ